jgi:hypothetical protein
MSDPTLTDRAAFMERLGGVVMLFAHLESWLNEFLGWLLEANPALMHTITVNVSSATITEPISALKPGAVAELPLPPIADLWNVGITCGIWLMTLSLPF